MNLTRRKFFGVVAGGAAAVAVAPSAIIHKSRSVGISTMLEAGPVTSTPLYGSGLITPQMYAQEFLNQLKSKMILGRLADGTD